MKLSRVVAALSLQTVYAGSLVEEVTEVTEIIVEAIELDGVVSEASVVYPQNITFPAPETYSGIGGDLGEPQHMDASYSNEIHQRIEDARQYVEKEIRFDEKLSSINHLCRNNHANCAFWSVIGECENNPAVSSTMLNQC